MDYLALSGESKNTGRTGPRHCRLSALILLGLLVWAADPGWAWTLNDSGRSQLTQAWGGADSFRPKTASQTSEAPRYTGPSGQSISPLVTTFILVCLLLALLLVIVVIVALIQRQKHRQDLLSSEARLRAIIDLAPMILWAIDRNGVFTFSEGSGLKDLGLAPGEAVGRSFYDLYGDNPEIVDSARRALNGETVSSVTEVGGVFFESRVNPVYDQSGRVTGAIGVAMDKTEQHLAEENYRKSKQQFLNIIQASPLGIHFYEVDGGGRLIFKAANPAADAILGVDHSHFLGLPLEEAFPPLAETEVGARYRQAAIEGRAWNSEQLTYQDGRIAGAFEVRAFQTAPGQMAAMFQDITERKQDEEALKTSEERYRELVDSVTDLIYTQDLEGRFLSLNPAAARTLGYEIQDIVGHHVTEFMRERDRHLFSDVFLPQIKAVGFQEGVVAYLSRSGAKRLVEYRSVLQTAADGRQYITGAGRDVTEKMLADREVRSLQDQLIQSQKMEAIGTLASGVAHDFNNILQIISGYLQILHGQPNLEPHQAKYLAEIEQANQRATELIKQLLTISRKRPGQLQPTDVNGELTQTVRMLERTIPKMIVLETSLGQGLWEVNGNPGQINQVLINLVNNAVDALGDSGRISIETANTVLDDDFVATHMKAGPGRYVLIKIGDNGPGMEKEVLSHIYEPFFTTKAADKGTGLGLATVYGIVRGHGGFLTCYSQVGQGTVFNIYLPALAESKTGLAEGPDLPELVPTGHETILLVDDEAAILDIGRDMLQRYGYKVITAQSEEEAVAIFEGRTLELDLVILDLGMPGMGGFKCLRHLTGLASEAKIIIASGYDLNGQVENVMEAGASGFIAKPYRLREMMGRIRQVLDSKSN